MGLVGGLGDDLGVFYLLNFFSIYIFGTDLLGGVTLVGFTFVDFLGGGSEGRFLVFSPIAAMFSVARATISYMSSVSALAG